MRTCGTWLQNPIAANSTVIDGCRMLISFPSHLDFPCTCTRHHMSSCVSDPGGNISTGTIYILII
jgi:hypothetical protein